MQDTTRVSEEEGKIFKPNCNRDVADAEDSIYMDKTFMILRL